MRLKQARETLKMDVEPFATACGVKKTAQYNYESGERSPNAEYFEKLAELGVDVHQLITGKPFESSCVLTGQRTVAELEPEEAALLVDYRGSTTDSRAVIRKVIAAFAAQDGSVNKTQGKE